MTNCSDEILLYILSQLFRISNDNEAKPHIAQSIYQLSQKNLFKTCSSERLFQIVDLLSKCSNQPNAKKYVAGPFQSWPWKGVLIIIPKRKFLKWKKGFLTKAVKEKYIQH